MPLTDAEREFLHQLPAEVSLILARLRRMRYQAEVLKLPLNIPADLLFLELLHQAARLKQDPHPQADGPQPI